MWYLSRWKSTTSKRTTILFTVFTRYVLCSFAALLFQSCDSSCVYRIRHYIFNNFFFLIQKISTGKFSIDATKACISCVKGRYQNSLGKETCIDCIVGQYQPNPESPSCLRCVPGKVSNAAASSSCEDCQIGKASTIAAGTVCVDCLAGFYQATIAGTSCFPCVPGMSQSNSKAAICIDCPLVSTFFLCFFIYFFFTF